MNVLKRKHSKDEQEEQDEQGEQDAKTMKKHKQDEKTTDTVIPMDITTPTTTTTITTISQATKMACVVDPTILAIKLSQVKKMFLIRFIMRHWPNRVITRERRFLMDEDCALEISDIDRVFSHSTLCILLFNQMMQFPALFHAFQTFSRENHLELSSNRSRKSDSKYTLEQIRYFQKEQIEVNHGYVYFAQLESVFREILPYKTLFPVTFYMNVPGGSFRFWHDDSETVAPDPILFQVLNQLDFEYNRRPHLPAQRIAYSVYLSGYSNVRNCMSSLYSKYPRSNEREFQFLGHLHGKCMKSVYLDNVLFLSEGQSVMMDFMKPEITSSVSENYIMYKTLTLFSSLFGRSDLVGQITWNTYDPTEHYAYVTLQSLQQDVERFKRHYAELLLLFQNYGIYADVGKMILLYDVGDLCVSTIVV